MTTLAHPNSAESTTFQLDLFSVPPGQTSLEDGSFTEYHPVLVLTSTGPIELNQLEKPVFPSAYVINSDPSSEPGEHWIAVYFDKCGRGEYFNSYGLAPAFVGLESYMDTYSLAGWIYIIKPYKPYFRTFAVTVVCIIFYFVLAVYLCMLLHLILRLT